jgi:hypothetical protein
MKKWFSRTTKSTALALIAIGVTVSIAWAAVEWLPNNSNTTVLEIRAPFTRFVEDNTTGIVVDPGGANDDDVIDFGPQGDWILFGGEDAAIRFDSGSPGFDSIEYDSGGASLTDDLLTINGDNVIVDSTVVDLNLSASDSVLISTDGGSGPFIHLDPDTGEIVLQMGSN